MVSDILTALNLLTFSLIFVSTGIFYSYIGKRKWPRSVVVFSSYMAFISISAISFSVLRTVNFPAWMGQPMKPMGVLSTQQQLPMNSSTSSKELISELIAEMFVGFISSIQTHPEQNAVEKYANGFGWTKTSTKINSVLNAKLGFTKVLAGQSVLIGSDGTNETFAISVRKDFNPEQFRSHLRGAVTLRSGTTKTNLGQKMELYRLFDGENQIGLIVISSGVADAISGAGTVGYLSATRAHKLGLGE